ncbi:hypothetical protein K1719_043789 [Acacia pycnantha]|nr:hypothetical protein K1719_043789 [Acacia pycnantha]
MRIKDSNIEQKNRIKHKQSNWSIPYRKKRNAAPCSPTPNFQPLTVLNVDANCDSGNFSLRYHCFFLDRIRISNFVWEAYDDQHLSQ